MAPDDCPARIASIASELVLIDSDDHAAWDALGGTLTALGGALRAAGRRVAAELADRLADLASHLAAGAAPDPEAAVARVHDCVNALQGFEGDSARDEAGLRQAAAQADLYLRDLAVAGGGGDLADLDAVEVEQEFLDEIQARIDGLEQTLLDLTPPVGEIDTVRAIFREIHTLKGEAGVLGLARLNQFYHDIESAIEAARHGELAFTAEALEILIELNQVGRSLLLRRGDGVEPERVADLVARLEATSAADPRAATATDEGPPLTEAEIEFLVARESGDQAEPMVESPVAGSPASVQPVSGQPVSGQPASGQPAMEDLADATPPASIVDEGDGEPEGGGEGAGEAGAVEESAVEAAHHTITLDVRQLDALLEMVGEVSMIGGHLSQSPHLAQTRELAAEAVDLARACRALQNQGARMRMTPVRPLFLRARRAALEAARSRGKRVEVQFEGAETLVDRTAMDAIHIGLLHLLRNAIDHGLEPADERYRANKPARGRIDLRARRTDADVVVEVADDGRGLDLEGIRRKAVERGLIAAGQSLDQRQTADLIFSSGLSTARSLSDISGRGVGMAAVREAIAGLRGRIEIDTTPGAGTCMRMRFPAALAAIEGLVVRVGASTLVLPVQVVREAVRVRPDQVSAVQGRGHVATIRGVVVPVAPLGDFLGLPGDAERIEDGVLLMVEDERHLAAVLVDEVLESRQVLIRPLEGELDQLRDVSGAALLADRKVALVVDPRRLLESTSVAAREAFQQAGLRQASAERQVETVQIGANAVGMIDFFVRVRGAAGLYDHAFAINAFKVREFVPAAAFTTMPNAPVGFVGLLLLRDRTIPVVCLSVLLGYQSEADRDPELEPIVVICEFSGRTVGFLVTRVNRVSYISWNDILPPPDSGGRVRSEYVVGSILRESLSSDSVAAKAGGSGGEAIPRDEVVFVLDFERIVSQVLNLYGDVGGHLDKVEKRKSRTCILLVEDSALIRRRTAEALRSSGFEVIEACDGQEAVDCLQEHHARAQAEGTSIFAYIDLVLSDIEMPRLDGYSLSTYVKSHGDLRVLPLLLHSSLTNETMIQRAHEVEADGFVPKCDPKELAEQLAKYI